MAVHYQVRVHDANAHLYAVTIELAGAQANQVLSLPVWIPGSYLLREFAKHLQNLRCYDDQGKALELTQLRKNAWKVASSAGQALRIEYLVYAFDPSVRSAYLDARRGFFNGTSLFLRVHGQEASPHQLRILPHQDWQIASSLPRGKAANYDELVDSPVEMGHFWSGQFLARGVKHRLVVTGAADTFDGKRLVADTQRICETLIDFWHAKGETPPHAHYTFFLHATQDAYGGLEHGHSTALICARKDLPTSSMTTPTEAYTQLLGLISHEYFHTWCVKRLRPAEFAHYDYEQENYTQLLWFFEGFTSYYDDLLLLKAGLIEKPAYLKLLNKTLNQVLQTPGRAVQSLAQSSFDAWVKYYRIDENSPNHTVSYYSKGALVALCFDLSLRSHGKSLGDVMRALWRKTAAGPMSEADFAQTLQKLTGRSWQKEIAAWIHGTQELPLTKLLAEQGFEVLQDDAVLAQRLGLRVLENELGVVVKNVFSHSAAEKAGLAAGDEILAVAAQDQVWRIKKLEELTQFTSAKRFDLLVARDRRVLSLALQMPAHAKVWRIQIMHPEKANAFWQGV